MDRHRPAQTGADRRKPAIFSTPENNWSWIETIGVLIRLQQNKPFPAGVSYLLAEIFFRELNADNRLGLTGIHVLDIYCWRDVCSHEEANFKIVFSLSDYGSYIRENIVVLITPFSRWNSIVDLIKSPLSAFSKFRAIPFPVNSPMLLVPFNWNSIWFVKVLSFPTI